MYNPFCQYCVGGRREEHKDEIKECDDKNCPFYRYRRTCLGWQEQVKHTQKIEN